MRLAFSVYGRRAIGKELAELTDLFDRSVIGPIQKASLHSRSGREDLSRDEIWASARATSADACSIEAAHGSVTARWFYGPNARAQAISGVATVGKRELGGIVDVLKDTCAWAKAVYAYCDEKAVTDRDIQSANGSLFRENGFFGLYWFNYFGPEFSNAMPLTNGVATVARVEVADGGGRVLLLGEVPGSLLDDNARLIADGWPFFAKYQRGAEFRPSVEIDYSALRGLDAPRSREEAVAAVVRDADGFIASVPVLADRFHQWTQSKGIAIATADDFSRVFRDHEAAIRDEFLLPAIAAYGEFIRARSGGVWTKAKFFHRGEPVIARRGRPWSNRRVVYEVLVALEHA
jgi:hypothetical protein